MLNLIIEIAWRHCLIAAKLSNDDQECSLLQIPSAFFHWESTSSLKHRTSRRFLIWNNLRGHHEKWITPHSLSTIFKPLTNFLLWTNNHKFKNTQINNNNKTVQSNWVRSFFIETLLQTTSVHAHQTNKTRTRKSEIVQNHSKVWRQLVISWLFESPTLCLLINELHFVLIRNENITRHLFHPPTRKYFHPCWRILTWPIFLLVAPILGW